ncbi:hypothetical protein BC834DRAFT_841971 [Gloeopeniophorella convolvens]|nr:hypothetical protein BC834DRAFT_841971 [Gloeopeniophorella convolvens]
MPTTSAALTSTLGRGSVIVRVAQDTALDVRIRDYSARVPRRGGIDKADPVLTPSPARTAILVALPVPTCDDDRHTHKGIPRYSPSTSRELSPTPAPASAPTPARHSRSDPRPARTPSSRAGVPSRTCPLA